MQSDPVEAAALRARASVIRPRAVAESSPAEWSFDACTAREELGELLRSSAYQERLRFQTHLAQLHSDDLVFSLPGFCKVCDRPVSFLVDRDCGARRIDGVWHPNWRERQVCPSCGLNSRQRAAASILSSWIRALESPRACVYLMEQVTPLFAQVERLHPGVELIGSEYLSPKLHGGEERGGLRHEDAQCLSFASDTLEVVASNDVLEHVPDPVRALAEIHRVLRKGGSLYLSVPFHGNQVANVTRCEVARGKLVHHLPPEYHGNPLSKAGSLVFTDFGWQLLADLAAVGFRMVQLRVFWSYQYGHLGIPQEFVHATK